MMTKRLTVPAMKTAKQQFAEGLKKAMEAAGYQAIPAVLAREFNLRYLGAPMTPHGVRRWLLGETLPSQEKVEVLASWLKITFQQLRPGSAVSNMAREQRANWRATIPQQERDIVDAFLALPVQQRKIIREVILAFAKTEN